MPKFIDITKIKNQIADFKRAVPCSNSDYLNGYISALSSVEGMIAETPTADVIEVVRCVECRNLDFVETSRGSAWRCRRNMVTEPYIHPDCYCCYGEKYIRSEQE